jgi:hypothetical protein
LSHQHVKTSAMKRIQIMLVALAAAIIVASCQKEEPAPVASTGMLHVNVGLLIHVNEVGSLLKSTNQTEDFKVIIYGADGTEIRSFISVTAMPDTIELETGEYYVEAHSDNNLPAAFENPYYQGISEPFTIGNNTHQTVTVTCTLANTIVSVLYSQNIRDQFFDYSTTVASTLDSLVFGKEETRLGYFQPLPLDITVQLSYHKPDGSPVMKSLTGSITDPMPNKHYEIQVDALINQGMASFQVLLDDSEVVMEVVDISEDSLLQPNGIIGYGELLITEIMCDPSAMSDTYGEWFEIYNNSADPVNLQHLVLERNGTNRHVITDSIVLEPSSFFVFTRTDTAMDASGSYVYGTSITLPNTGAMLSISNKETTTGPGELIFGVDYSGTGFPSGSGASISLDPSCFDPVAAILGSSWCLSSTMYGTGDLGTPGRINDACH